MSLPVLTVEFSGALVLATSEDRDYHAKVWEGEYDTFACKECGDVLPVGHAHGPDCASLVLIYPEVPLP